jgi:hypothetical protein
VIALSSQVAAAGPAVAALLVETEGILKVTAEVRAGDTAATVEIATIMD